MRMGSAEARKSGRETRPAAELPHPPALHAPEPLVRNHFEGCTMVRLVAMAANSERIDQAKVGESNA
jgi:hypothetical protein